MSATVTETRLFSCQRSPQQSQYRNESQALESSSQCTSSQPSQRLSMSKNSQAWNGNLSITREDSNLDDHAEQRIPQSPPENMKNSGMSFETPGTSKDVVVETPEDSMVEKNTRIESQNSEDGQETMKLSKAVASRLEESPASKSPRFSGPLDTSDSNFVAAVAGPNSVARALDADVRRGESSPLPTFHDGSGSHQEHKGITSDIEKKALDKVAVLENTLSDIRVKRRRMQDQMKDLISVEAKHRRYKSTISDVEKAEKEAIDELEAAKLNLAAAEERLRSAERRVKEVKEDKTVAHARGASLAQEHVQAKETLQETKDAVASLVTKLHKAT